MSSVLRPYVTMGVALVGASLIAVTPVVPPPPAVQVRAVRLADVDATSSSAPETITFYNYGTGSPYPSDFGAHGYVRFVEPNYPDSITRILSQPAQAYGLAIHNDYLDSTERIAQVVTNTEMNYELAEGRNVVLFGYSGGATENTMEMRYLMSLPANQQPTPDQLAFLLLGDPNNDNGGMLARFDIPGLQTPTMPSYLDDNPTFTGSTGVISLPTLGITFNGPTPVDQPWHNIIYTGEYDGFSDFPKYPDDLLADINAAYGIAFVHNNYMGMPVSEIKDSFLWQPSAGYDGNTTWYIVPVHDLPMLDPLRDVPVIGTPLADLLQPDLKVLVNLGFGPDNVPYSEYPNVFTPIQPGLPDVSPTTLFNELVAGAKEGIQNFQTDLSQITPSDVTEALQQLAAHPLDILTGLASAFTLGMIPQISLPTVTPLDLTPSNFADQLQILLTDNSSALATIFTQPSAFLEGMTSILTVMGGTIPTYDMELAGLGIHDLLEGNLNSAGTYFGDIPAFTAGLYSIATDLIIGPSVIADTLGNAANAATGLLSEDLNFLAGLPGLLS